MSVEQVCHNAWSDIVYSGVWSVEINYEHNRHKSEHFILKYTLEPNFAKIWCVNEVVCF